MEKLFRMRPFLLVNAIGFYVLPFLGQSTGRFMFIIMFEVTGICFMTGVLYGVKNKVSVYYALASAVLFLPALVFYQNSEIWIYCLLYCAVSFAGTIVGYVLNSGGRKVAKTSQHSARQSETCAAVSE